MKKPKLSRKRCSPLPDIYTPIEKTSNFLRARPSMMYKTLSIGLKGGGS